MPGRDGTGPLGQGSMTGRGAGMGNRRQSVGGGRQQGFGRSQGLGWRKKCGTGMGRVGNGVFGMGPAVCVTSQSGSERHGGTDVSAKGVQRGNGGRYRMVDNVN